METPKQQADRLIARGKQLLTRGDLPQATELLNRAVKIYWAAGEQYAAAAQIGNYGWALRRMGRADLARPYLQEAAELFDGMGLADFAARHRVAADDVAAEITPEFLESLPAAVRGAIERGDGAALQFALGALSAAEQEIIFERLVAVGIVRDPGGDEGVGDALQQFEPLLQGIAAVARGDLSERDEIELTLQDLERKGWQIRKPVEKIWQGQRKLNPLTNGLDEADLALIRRILEILEA
ncbi:MAG: tetratricopeptide repeat protein [Oscillochloris sp.]|nr:tetratricopeptide repeat protein [Oscillochloris sp.]